MLLSISVIKQHPAADRQTGKHMHTQQDVERLQDLIQITHTHTKKKEKILTLCQWYLVMQIVPDLSQISVANKLIILRPHRKQTEIHCRVPSVQMFAGVRMCVCVCVAA